jgi:hypothetical protein
MEIHDLRAIFRKNFSNILAVDIHAHVSVVGKTEWNLTNDGRKANVQILESQNEFIWSEIFKDVSK